MIDKKLSAIKGSPTHNPVKKAHRISNTTFIVIDESIVKQLVIDENDTWFEQEANEDGIVLRIRKGLHDLGVGKL